MESSGSKANAASSACRSLGVARIFFRHALATSNSRRLGARSEAPRSPATTVSRANSLNSNATMADASTTLSVTVFADQPRRFVPPREIKLTDPFGNLVIGQPARRGPCRLVDHGPQFALQLAMIGLGALAQPLHLFLGTPLMERSMKMLQNGAILARKREVHQGRSSEGARRASNDYPTRERNEWNSFVFASSHLARSSARSSPSSRTWLQPAKQVNSIALDPRRPPARSTTCRAKSRPRIVR
jgi:hypothetical protein